MTPSSPSLVDAGRTTGPAGEAVERPDRPGPAPETDEAGSYPTGRAGLVRGWDGHAWTGGPVWDRTAPSLPSPRHSLRPTRRFWAAVAALVVGVALGAVGSAQPGAVLRATLLTGAALVSTGGALLALTSSVWHRLRLTDAVTRNGWSTRRLVGLGAASGVLAVGLALGVELACGRVFGKDSVTVLFLAGPVEETAKLVLPVVLLWTLRGRLSDPRLGFALVWLCGTTFGLLEGIEYVVGLGPKSAHLPTGETATVIGGAAQTAIRALVELMHPMLTAAAAAALWLGAWRRGRLLGGAGLLAYLTAVALHSINDGVLGGWVHDASAGLAVVGSPVMLLLIYAVLRLRSRELAPPSRVVDLPVRWRPHVQGPASEARRAEHLHPSIPRAG